MFSYWLSIVVAFLFFGTVNNILLRLDLKWYFSENEKDLAWVSTGAASLVWFFALPLLLVLFIMFLLKLLTDKISAYIINYIKDRNVGKTKNKSLTK